MNFIHFTSKKTHYATSRLGGQISQFKLAPQVRLLFPEEKIKEKKTKKAAVLALFYPDKNNNTQFLLTKRANYNGAHSAQISFTGGKVEKGESLQETALRETFEEVGIQQSEVKIIRQLSKTYIPPSNFLVTPFIGYLNTTPVFKPNYEVATIIEVALSDLLDDVNISSKELTTSYMKNVKVPCFKFQDHIVWGATAMILSEIKDLLKT